MLVLNFEDVNLEERVISITKNLVWVTVPTFLAVELYDGVWYAIYVIMIKFDLK